MRERLKSDEFLSPAFDSAFLTRFSVDEIAKLLHELCEKILNKVYENKVLAQFLLNYYQKKKNKRKYANNMQMINKLSYDFDNSQSKSAGVRRVLFRSKMKSSPPHSRQLDTSFNSVLATLIKS